jgi:methionyl-tRNA formyltransferase
VTLRLAFMGTSDFAVPALTEIVGQGHSVAAVYTRAPRPAGRGMQERRSPVHEAAARLDLPVFTPVSLRLPEEQAAFAALDLDVAVVVAYGLVLPKAFLEAPTFGCLNIHASLLPRWRGAAPIQRAIMAGDSETGVTIMQMDEGLDTGPIAMAERIEIGRDMTAGDLRVMLARLGADLIVRALAALARARWIRGRNPPGALPMPGRSTNPKRGSTGRALPWRSTTGFAAFHRRPARGVRWRSAASASV